VPGDDDSVFIIRLVSLALLSFTYYAARVHCVSIRLSSVDKLLQ